MRVARVLDQLGAERGLPEFAGRALESMGLRERGAPALHRSGQTVQNASIESFNGRFRDECLNGHWFRSYPATRRIMDTWRDDYNAVRAHSALGNRTPREFTHRRGRDTPVGF